MSATKTIIEFVAGERGSIAIHTVAAELEKLGRLNPNDWPVDSYDNWRTAIDGCVASGMLVSDGRGNVATPKIEKEPKNF